MTRSRAWHVLKRALQLLVLLLACYLFLTPTGHYLLRGAWEEGKILAHRKSMEAIVADPATKPAVRAKLALVLASRVYARDSLHLDTKQSFTQFTQLEHDTLTLLLSGAYRDRLLPKTWWFPVVGRVPYKGYFDFAAAKKAAADLEHQEFDVQLRPVSAFSTLGWFNDPLLSTTLRADSLDLSDTVIHELLHNTFYANGQTAFNESFANFVGARGAAAFFRSRGAEKAALEVEARWEDQKVLATFWRTLYQSVDSAFKAHPDSKPDRLVARDTLFARARQELVWRVGPQLRTIGPRSLERAVINNATIMARRLYLTDVQLFDDVWQREGRDLNKAKSRIIELAKSDAKDPYGALRKWVDALPPGEAKLAVDGGRIWYKVTKGGSGVPLILIHGGPGVSSFYLKPYEDLKDDRTVVRYDQLGSGKSDGLTDTTRMTIEHFVAELEALRAHLGLEKVALLGHSWGTIVAVEYYKRHPEHVAALVLQGVALDVPAWTRNTRKLVATLSDSARRAIAIHEADRNYDAPSFLAASDEYFGLYVSRHPVAADGDSIVHSMNQKLYVFMEGPTEFTITGTIKDYDATLLLRTIKVPTLFTVGEFDEADVATTRRLAALTPGAQFAEIMGAAHLSMWDSRAENLRVVREFLRTVR